MGARPTSTPVPKKDQLVEFLTPTLFVGLKFLISNLFLMNSNAVDVPRGGFKFCLDTGNNGALALNLAYFT